MKMVLVVCNTYFVDRLRTLLKANAIDYYTSWDKATGKGRGTELHLGAGAYGSTNTVTMIAFEDEAPLEALIRGIGEADQEIPRAADRIRLIQLPLERIV